MNVKKWQHFSDDELKAIVERLKGASIGSAAYRIMQEILEYLEYEP